MFSSKECEPRCSCRHFERWGGHLLFGRIAMRWKGRRASGNVEDRRSPRKQGWRRGHWNGPRRPFHAVHGGRCATFMDSGELNQQGATSVQQAPVGPGRRRGCGLCVGYPRRHRRMYGVNCSGSKEVRMGVRNRFCFAARCSRGAAMPAQKSGPFYCPADRDILSRYCNSSPI